MFSFIRRHISAFREEQAAFSCQNVRPMAECLLPVNTRTTQYVSSSQYYVVVTQNRHTAALLRRR